MIDNYCIYLCSSNYCSLYYYNDGNIIDNCTWYYCRIICIYYIDMNSVMMILILCL